jgi:aspartyl/asparaginyl beta-hydroxylase (cupin superfamily)
MTLEQAKKLYQEIKELKKRYGISYSEYHEEERDGEIRLVNVILKIRIDKK